MSKSAKLIVTVMTVVVVLIVGGLVAVLITGQSAEPTSPANRSGPSPNPPTAGQALPTVSDESCRNVSSSMDCSFLSDNRWAGIVRNGLGQRPDLARSVKGYTVGLVRVYADPTAIVLGVEVTTPNGDNYQAGNYKLTNPQGQPLEGQEATFSANINPGQGGTTHQILVFTPPEGAAASQTLSLHFEVAELGPARISRPGPMFTPTSVPVSQPTSTEPSTERIEGPFSFDLNVPFYQTKLIEGSRVTKLSGPAQIAVDKVVITPLKLVIYLKNSPPRASMTVAVGTWDSSRLDPPAGAGSRRLDDSDLTEFTLNNVPPAGLQTGQWQLTLIAGGDNLPTAVAATVLTTATPAPTRPSDPTATPFPFPTPIPPVVLAAFSFKL